MGTIIINLNSFYKNYKRYIDQGLINELKTEFDLIPIQQFEDPHCCHCIEVKLSDPDKGLEFLIKYPLCVYTDDRSKLTKPKENNIRYIYENSKN